MVSLTDRPDMTLDVYRGRKTTIQYNRWENEAIFLDVRKDKRYRMILCDRDTLEQLLQV